MLIIGQQEAHIDSKNRVALPKKFRSQLGSELVITQGYEGSLILVSADNFEKIVAETANLPFTMQNARHTNRYLLGNADKVELDSQGRFIVPEYLRNFASLTDEVIFVGVGSYLEMWDKKAWGAYQEFLSTSGSDIAEKLRNGTN